MYLTVAANSLWELIDGPSLHTECWVEPILPRSSKLIFGGHSKIGKSHLMMNLVRSLVSGENTFGCDRFVVREPTNVLIFEQELGEMGLQRRARQVFAGSARYREARYISRNPDVTFSSEKGYEFIGNEIAEFKPGVVIFDPIGKMYHGDENSAQEVALLWQKIDRLLRLGADQQMSVVLSHHFGKKPNGDRNREGHDPLDAYNFRGSSKWFDDVDALITVNRLANTATTHQAWRIQTRFELRHSEAPPEMFFTINQNNDLRVRFDREVEPSPPPTITPLRTQRTGTSTDPRARE